MKLKMRRPREVPLISTRREMRNKTVSLIPEIQNKTNKKTTGLSAESRFWGIWFSAMNQWAQSAVCEQARRLIVKSWGNVCSATLGPLKTVQAYLKQLIWVLMFFCQYFISADYQQHDENKSSERAVTNIVIVSRRSDRNVAEHPWDVARYYGVSW